MNDITVYLDGSTQRRPKTLPVAEVVEGIRGGSLEGLDFAAQVVQVAERMAAGGKKAANPLKVTLPAIVWSARMEDPKTVAEHSGIMCADLDALPPDKLSRLAADLKRDPKVLAFFRSPSGTGLKVLVAVEAADAAGHKSCFKEVKRYFASVYGMADHFDNACSNVNRLCFISHDPEIHLSGMEPQSFKPAPAVKREPLKRAENVEETGKRAGSRRALLAEKTESRLKMALEYVPADDYDTWVRIGIALRRWNDERGFALWLAWSASAPEAFDDQSCYDRWEGFAEAAPENPLTIASVFRMAQELGWDGRSKSLDWSAAATPPSAQFDSAPEVIGGTLRKGRKMLLGGASKSFKTWQLMELSVLAAADPDADPTPWLGRFVIPGQRVAYLNFEMMPDTFNKRLRTLAARHGMPIEGLDARLTIFHLRGFDIQREDLVAGFVDEHGFDRFDVVVIDPMYKIMTDVNDIAANETTKALNQFDWLAKHTGAAVIFAAHFAKGDMWERDTQDRISGSGALARDPDAIVVLTKRRGGETYQVEWILREFPGIAPIDVAWDGGGFVERTAEEAVEEAAERAAERAAAAESAENERREACKARRQEIANSVVDAMRTRIDGQTSIGRLRSWATAEGHSARLVEMAFDLLREDPTIEWKQDGRKVIPTMKPPSPVEHNTQHLYIP